MNHSPTDQLKSEAVASSSPSDLPCKVLSAGQLEAIEQHLKSLPPRHKLTAQAAIAKLIPSIEKLRARGYTIDEVATELKTGWLNISARTLARHLRSGMPKKRASETQ